MFGEKKDFSFMCDEMYFIVINIFMLKMTWSRRWLRKTPTWPTLFLTSQLTWRHNCFLSLSLLCLVRKRYVLYVWYRYYEKTFVQNDRCHMTSNEMFGEKNDELEVRFFCELRMSFFMNNNDNNRNLHLRNKMDQTKWEAHLIYNSAAVA